MRYFFVLFMWTCFTSLSVGQITITGYNHVALTVKDIEKSTIFYRDTVGLAVIPVPKHLQAIRSWFRIAEGQELHLLADRREAVTNNDPNHCHFSMTVTNADAVEVHLKALNVKYLRQQRFDGIWQIYITDPDGYSVEFNEAK